MKIAVIPARGGSKRIPRKNIKPFCGKPMIAWSIEAAKASSLFDSIIVSTDDEEIAEISRQWGAATPFERPADLADDHTPTVPVIAHAVRTCQEMGWPVTHACCIYPCAPLIEVRDLKEAFSLLDASGAPYSFPIMEFPSAIQRALRRDGSGRMSPFYAEHELTRTQDLERAFHDAGQFYWGTTAAWLRQGSIYCGSAGLLVPRWRAVDIDCPEDWEQAELLHEVYMRRGMP